MDRLRILFVDDEEELVSAVVERLQLRDVDARGVTTCADGLAEIAARTYDVVVLDVRMPGSGGLGVLCQIERMDPRPAVILLSGHGSSEYKEEGLRHGAYDYLQKPVDLNKLLDIARRAAGQAPPADEPD